MHAREFFVYTQSRSISQEIINSDFFRDLVGWAVCVVGWVLFADCTVRCVVLIWRTVHVCGQSRLQTKALFCLFA